tara:strand:- start:8 stop:358 length:351 start_codon:yes stop_codon:yes gene_type:complete
LYDWIVDNGMTPHLMVDAGYPDTLVPEKYIKDGKVVLNISTASVKELDLGNELISFNARFDGQPIKIMVPVNAVMAIYARENGNGMIFAEETLSNASTVADDKPPEIKKPSLKIVK